MFNIHLVKVLILAALLIAGSEAKPVRGRKRAFGMGLLGGALAGAVVGNAVAKASGSSKAAAPASPPVAQVVETGVPDRNGCYRQTIKEPMPGHPKIYTETVHLVCPNGLAAANPQPVVVVPAQVVPAVTYSVVAAPAVPIAATSNHTQANSLTQSNATHTQTILVHPGTASVPSAAVPAAVPAPASAPATAPHSGLTIVYASAPNPQAPAQPQQTSQPGAAHVILLSKTVKKQKSGAPTLNVSHGLLILVIFFCILYK